MAKKKVHDPAVHVPLQFMEAMIDDSDRACVLVAHGFIDERLKCQLKTAFGIIPYEVQRHFAFREANYADPAIADWLMEGNHNPPLQSFSVKAKLAHCLGLISRSTHQAMQSFNKMRISHAHFGGRVKLSTKTLEGIRQELWGDPYFSEEHDTLGLYDFEFEQWLEKSGRDWSSEFTESRRMLICIACFLFDRLDGWSTEQHALVRIQSAKEKSSSASK